MSDRPGCSSAFSGTPVACSCLAPLVGAVVGAVGGGVVANREYGPAHTVVGVVLGVPGGAIAGVVLVALLGASYATLSTLFDKGFGGVVNMWTPVGAIEWTAAILVVVGAVVGGVIGSRSGVDWVVPGIVGGAVALPVAGALVAVLAVAVAGFVWRLFKAGGESDGNGK